MSSKTGWPVLIVLLLLANAGLAQEEFKKHPGYFNFDEIAAIFDEEPIIEVNLKGFLLSMAAGATRYSDPELADVLDDLEFVRVEKYEVNRAQRAKIREKNGELAKKLDAAGWERIVRVREHNDDVHVYLKPEKKGFVGIVVLALDREGAVFVNIIGTIDPEKIGRIGSKWNIDELDSIHFQRKSKK